MIRVDYHYCNMYCFLNHQMLMDNLTVQAKNFILNFIRYSYKLDHRLSRGSLIQNRFSFSSHTFNSKSFNSFSFSFENSKAYSFNLTILIDGILQVTKDQSTFVLKFLVVISWPFWANNGETKFVLRIPHLKDLAINW